MRCQWEGSTDPGWDVGGPAWVGLRRTRRPWDRTGRGSEGGADDEQRMDLGALLVIPCRRAKGRKLRAPQSAGFDDWTLAQCRVFQRITPEGLTCIVATTCPSTG